ncbi:MAG: ABC transporter substrate-binding protein [Thermodesulfobacteriota bacterium]|nr:ABC transporter substrate-binding protein [Thermodesulfobacteriota bacterium]
MSLSKKTIAVFLLMVLCILFLSPLALSKEQKHFVLLLRMMDRQHRWFRKNIIAPFEKNHDVHVATVPFDRFWDLEVILRLERDSSNHATGLVKVPLEMTRPLKDFMIPYDDLMGKEELEVLKSQYDTKALAMGTISQKLYYIPRKLETRTMIYLKSKTDEAVKGWKAFEAQIDGALKDDNGCGLPAGYDLEKDPNLWDYYDLFVVSYYWAHTPYYGIKMPRMAHRAKKYGGTVAGLVDRIYQMGGSPKDVVNISASHVVDMFVWEAVYKKHGLYHPGMWQDPWSGGGIWNAMKDGKVFLAMMHQLDSFFIHGGTHAHMQGYLANPDDMRVALMPKGVSFDLDSKGSPLRIGTRKAGTAGWWWGIPKTAPHPSLSVALANWITNYDNHLAECEIFGMMPIRKDILTNLQEAFPSGWMAHVFNVSMRQLEVNGNTTIPLLLEYPEIGRVYLNAWYDIVVAEDYGKRGKVDRDYIRKKLDRVYAPQVKEVLGNRYPK